MGFQEWISEGLSQVVELLPLGYAFGAGMVSAVNPCGFAMLPAYLSLYLGADQDEFYARSWWLRFGKAIWITSAVSLGFVFLFGTIGSAVAAGGTILITAMPWIAAMIGVMLIILSIPLLLGKQLSSFHLFAHLEGLGDARTIGFRGFFLFGIAFGAASLSCTLPIFLAVAGSAATAGEFLSGLLQFILYGLGMGTVLLGLTLSIALLKEGVAVDKVRKFLPYVQRLSAGLLFFAGSYIVYYWWVNGGLTS